MNRAKTSKKIFMLVSAIIGVVFACLMGTTYCLNSLTWIFGSDNLSTSAYMGNQNYHLINDTTTTPVAFGEGSHNFEIAMHYSFCYNFDVRIKYKLSWTGGLSTDNVILKFANKDNVIYDENYIFIADAVTAGDGKLPIITGVEFVDPTDKAYHGAKLTITIESTDVKVYKEQTSYTESHYLYSSVSTSDAAKAWLQYKKNSKAATGTATNAYVLMYNYRRDYAHGFAYSPLNSAYKKPVATETYSETTGEGNDQVTVNFTKDNVYGSVWTGGNRAYAGTNMYVIAGSSPLELTVQVGGIWRTSGDVELATENNIQYNYTSNWTFKNYSTNTLLWEVRTFNYSIPANTGCFIDILDSIEITSAGTQTTATYRMVTNEINVNDTKFSYTGATGDYIQYKQISAVSSVKTAYAQEDVTVVNTTKYSNGLYNSTANAQQTYNGNITLINNTAEVKKATVSLKLNYHISNGVTSLYDADDETKTRAVDLIDRKKTYTYKQAFNGASANSAVNSLYYSYTGDATSYLTQINNLSVSTYEFILEPYSSVNVLSSYSVAATLAGHLLTEFNDAQTLKRNEYYDVWTYIDATVATTSSTATPNLVMQSRTASGKTTISVKNNTNKTLTGIQITDFALRYYTETKSAVLEKAPADWEASFWKYYYSENSQDVQLTSLPNPFVSNKYYTITRAYSLFVINRQSPNYTLLNSFNFKTNDDSTALINASQVLLPGESVDVITLNTGGTVMISGKVSTTTKSTQSDITIINNGKFESYIVNYSSNSYYLRINGTATGVNFEKIDGYTYYIGIVRPGQIINMSMSAAGTIAAADKIVVSGNYSDTTLDSWNSTTAESRFTQYFNINKTI